MDRLDDTSGMNGLAETERKTHQSVWSHNGYRPKSPGEHIARAVKLDTLFKRLGVHSILDAGCGSGKTMRFFLESDLDWFELTGLDIAANCLDPWFSDNDFEHLLQFGSLWDPRALPNTFDAVVCTDVMKHIPANRVDDVLYNLRRWSSKLTFLGIALFDDGFETMQLNEPQYLTVKPPKWWIQRIEQVGYHIMSQQVSHQDGQPQSLYVMATPI